MQYLSDAFLNDYFAIICDRRGVNLPRLGWLRTRVYMIVELVLVIFCGARMKGMM